MYLMRRNPRKLSMPILKETARASTGVGVVALANTVFLPMYKSPNAAAAVVAAELAGAIMLSNRYPLASASVAGGILNAVFTSVAALITNDATYIAWNPQMSRDIEEVISVSGLPENIAYALGA